ncbi:MAG: rod shape-determining protein MreC [Capsulimonadales bacterium]|nr:rod shape-determining protein MreC [Capsulimonadales bacterium]
MSPWQRRSGLPRRIGSSGSLPVSAPVVLALTLTGSLALGILHKKLRSENRPDPVLAVVSTVVYPFQWGASRMEANLWGVWDWLFEARTVARDNTRLEAENLRLKLEVESLRRDAAEAERLRRVLKFSRSEKKNYRLAPVIGWLPSPHFETLQIGAGTREGVRIGSIVRTPDGLVGQVFEVGPLSSQVLLLSDTDSRVHVLVYRNGKPLKPFGVVQGRGRGASPEAVYFKMEDDIRPGDLLRTSGFGTVFPADIPVGTIMEITEDKVRSLKRARIEPFAPMPGPLREVLFTP